MPDSKGLLMQFTQVSLHEHRSGGKGGEWILRGKKNLSTFVQGPKMNVKQTANDTGETTNSTIGWSKR